ncbi:MAG: AMP-binding protein, partial [Pseudomonadota bacterium]
EYEAIRASFRWRTPDHFNFAVDVVDRWAQQSPEATALRWVDGSVEHRLTFANISRRSSRAANVLAQAGVRRGDRVILMLGRHIAWWETFTACLRMGAVAAPATTQLSPNDLAYRIKASGAVCLITDDAGAAKADQIDDAGSLSGRITVDGPRPGWTTYEDAMGASGEDFQSAETEATADAICYFTSGTTGYPKMTIHSQASYGIGHETTGRHWLDLSPGDLHWNISDTGWAKAAWSSYFAPWICGATVFVHGAEGFSPATVLKTLDTEPITTLCAAPTIYRMLVLEDLSKYDFSALRTCVSAGEPLNPEIIETWRNATGLTIRDGYGQTETVLLCGTFPGLPQKQGSMGRPAPGFDVQ